MATQTISMAQNDLLPKLQVTIYDNTGTLVDLTNVQGVFVNIGTDAADLIVSNRPMQITNAKQGLCHYFWQAGETSTPGQYTGEVVVMYAGKPQTAVTFTLIINPSLH